MFAPLSRLLGLFWTGIFPKGAWFCSKTKPSEPNPHPAAQWEQRALRCGKWIGENGYPDQSKLPCKYVYIHTSGGSMDKDHFSTPWCQKVPFCGSWALREAEMVCLSLAASFELAPGTGPCMPRSNATTCIHLREGLLISANQSLLSVPIFLQYKRKTQVTLASLEPFSASDQLLSSAGQASGQERQGAHHKFTLRVRKNPSQWLLCVLRQREWENKASRDITEKYIFSSCLCGSQFGGVEGCFVLVGSFGFIQVGFFCCCCYF